MNNKDLRQISKQVLLKHVGLFVDWFVQHPPFPDDMQGLINIANGEVADKNVNCHKAFEIGIRLADSITGKTFGDVKLKRNDKIYLSTYVLIWKFLNFSFYNYLFHTI